jgi:predicted enzyme related to lactoylglutathione lyase
MAAPVVWFEIAGRDLDALTRFDGDLLGWKVDADNPQHYGMVDTGAEGGIPGGIFAPGAQVGEYVSFYAAVQGLEERLEHAARLGGKVVQPPTPKRGRQAPRWRPHRAPAARAATTAAPGRDIS